mmetsp:Transcript_62195/g.181580  ORF Transcript_62195/g.181580 Transcript_62195/m.181580 type:complete len:410 (-) Transcript_62195:77-1306(-)
MSIAPLGTATDTETLVPLASSSRATIVPGDASNCGARSCRVPNCLNSCSVDSKPPPQQTSFVGSGRGGYRQEHSYKYVGLGSGNFDLKRVPPISPACWWILGGVSLLAPALLVVLALSFGGSGDAAASSSANLPQHDIAREGPPNKYDCTAERGDWQQTWSPSKKAWCCLYNNFGCSESYAGQYDCNADFLDWVKHWSKDKQVWCCLHTRRGCPTAGPHAAGEPDGASSRRETTSLPFYCTVGLINWQLGWSAHKKRWCCAHEGRGCRNQQEEEPLDAVIFNCNTGYSNWKHGWSSMKAAWCCKHHFVGCRPQDPFDCDRELLDWQSSWAEEKQDWCCRHRSKGCAEALPFDCNAGFSNWTLAWADSKKTWCCEHERRGCAYSCNETSNGTWSQLEKYWCCQEKRKGCP